VLHGLAASFFIPVTVTQKTSPNGLSGATVQLPRTTPADELVLVNIGGARVQWNGGVATLIGRRDPSIFATASASYPSRLHARDYDDI
jgi:hypothetical protein